METVHLHTVSDSGDSGSSSDLSGFSVELNGQFLQAELDTLSDLDKDGITGINLSQEIYNPNPNAPNNTINNSTSRFAYTDDNGGIVISRNGVAGLDSTPSSPRTLERFSIMGQM